MTSKQGKSKVTKEDRGLWKIDKKWCIYILIY